MGNLETVQHIYAAFGRGDVPAILAHLADSVEWEYGLRSTDVPWLQPRQGRAEVPRFFASLSDLEFHHFQPKTFLEQDDVVVVLVDLEATVKATGKRIVEEDEVHLWYFNEAGQVRKFRHRADTHQHWAALRGEVVPQA